MNAKLRTQRIKKLGKGLAKRNKKLNNKQVLMRLKFCFGILKKSNQ